MLELRDVVKHYAGADGEPIRAVDGVSLAVGAGEVLALYGPSGSGKTTLLLLAAGLSAPDQGAVRFDGRELHRMSGPEAARYRLHELGFVYQSFQLVPGLSALDNTALKLMATGMRRREARMRAAPILELVGLGARARHASTGLSMGEQQRVAIARALSNDPRLILADEPTGSLDTRRGHDVLGLLRELTRERSVGVLLVTHDPDAATYADRVFTLRDGQLVEGAAASAEPCG